MEAFWQKYKFWILTLTAASVAYFLVFHAQFMPLRDGLYACRSMVTKDTDGEPRFLAANNDLMWNPVNVDHGEWNEDSVLVEDNTINILLGKEDSIDLNNRLTNIPLLAKGIPQEGKIYFRSFGISDFVVTKADPSAKSSQITKVSSYYLMQCHKDW